MIVIKMLLRCVVWVHMIAAINGQVWTQPEQVHLSATADATEMMVTWSTFNKTNNQSTVEYGLEKPDIMALGNSTKFVDGGTLNHTQYIHRVKLTNLKPGNKYVYRCGSDQGWSSVFYFRALQAGSNWSPRLAIYGDMGSTNAQSLPRLQLAAEGGQFDAILHNGDFAYDLDADDGKVGDEFMREIQAVAAYVPYMTAVGNHENKYNFSNYKNRFTMPSYHTNQNLWYSWNIGPAHLIFFSTEVYFFHEYSKETLSNQLTWLEKDLEEANTPENRAMHPWLITLGHRPMYCTTTDKDDCDSTNSTIRLALEKLFYDNGVDIIFGAHEHNYERMWPVYNEKVYNGSYAAPYTNAKAPIHFISGSAGCRERISYFKPPKPWDAFRSTDYGYTLMQLVNATHVTWQQVSDDQGGKVIDQGVIIKDVHGPEAWLRHGD